MSIEPEFLNSIDLFECTIFQTFYEITFRSTKQIKEETYLHEIL